MTFDEVFRKAKLSGLIHPKEKPALYRLFWDEAQAHNLVPMVDLRAAERHHIEGVLIRCRGNRVQAARVLRISRQTILNRLAEWRSDGSRRNPKLNA